MMSSQNIDSGYSLGGSNEYPQSKFLSRNKNNNAYPCKHQFYYIKVGFKGVKIIETWFRYVAIALAYPCACNMYAFSIALDKTLL